MMFFFLSIDILTMRLASEREIIYLDSCLVLRVVQIFIYHISWPYGLVWTL